MMGPLVLGGNVQVQVPDVVTPVTTVVAVVRLLNAWLAAGGALYCCVGGCRRQPHCPSWAGWPAGQLHWVRGGGRARRCR